MPQRQLVSQIMTHLPGGPATVAVTASYSVAAEIAPTPLSEAALMMIGPYALTLPALSALVAILVGIVTLIRHVLEIRKLRREK